MSRKRFAENRHSDPNYKCSHGFVYRRQASKKILGVAGTLRKLFSLPEWGSQLVFKGGRRYPKMLGFD